MSLQLHDLPNPAMVVDGALAVSECNRRCLAVFGLRGGSDPDSWNGPLTQSVSAEPDLGDELALATARLVAPGDAELIAWSRQARTWEVTVSAMAGEGQGAAVDRFLVLFADVTDRELEREIQLNARHYLEQVLNDVPMGVTVLGRDLRVTSANRKMLGFLERMGGRATLVEAVGAPLGALAPGAVGAAWQELGERVLGEGVAVQDERRAFGDGEGELVVGTGMTPLRDRRGELAGVIAMTEDVSEETRLQRELVRAEKLATVGQMVITVNHEINNPLTIIAANAQAMRLLGGDRDEKALKKLESIERQVRRISEVTERLRNMDEVASSEYIEAGPSMIDLWRDSEEKGR